MVAGGMESMTNAPYLLPKARGGLRMGHGQVIDHMFYDGLEDAYDKGRLMGSFAEECAAKYQFTREAQDAFAITSLTRAQKANKDGSFAWEIAPLAIKVGKDEKFIEMDEQPFKANLDKIPTLKPAFRKDGTVTAANSSSISDGAAALVMMRRSTAEKRGARAPRHGGRPRDACAGARAGSRRRRSARFESCLKRRAGRRKTSTYTRSTRHSPWSPWRR